MMLGFGDVVSDKRSAAAAAIDNFHRYATMPNVDPVEMAAAYDAAKAAVAQYRALDPNYTQFDDLTGGSVMIDASTANPVIAPVPVVVETPTSTVPVPTPVQPVYVPPIDPAVVSVGSTIPTWAWLAGAAAAAYMFLGGKH